MQICNCDNETDEIKYIRNSNLINFDGVRKMSEGFERKQLEIKIVYYKSSSKYYDSVCLQCEGMNGYNQEKSTNTLCLTLDELKENQNKIRLILDIIKNWSKTEYYIDGACSSWQQIETILEIFECEKNCKSCINCNEYCYDNMGWGCKLLNVIQLRKGSYYHYRSNPYWYEYGYFDNGEWVVDKDRILNHLLKQASETHAEICECFSMERLQDAIALLPDKINVTDEKDCEWEYKYREAPWGMQQTEIIGIKPREKEEDSSWRLSALDFLNSSKDETEKEQKEVPTVTFADIGGIDEIVQHVREVIELPLVLPAVFEHYHIKPHKGILLYGPPGCGKTLLAKAVANEINAHFITVNGPEILNKYIGESESNLRKIFDEAKRLAPAVVYFDEFDSISLKRDAESNPHMATVVNQLLTLMDGMDDANKICVIASTNRIDMIDEAVRRPGRFDYVIEIKKPSLDGCKAIFRIHTSKMPVEESFDRDKFVEEYLVGSTGAEIAFVASEAAYNSIRRTIDLSKVFSNDFSFTVSSENIIKEEDFIKAVHSLKEGRNIK